MYSSSPLVSTFKVAGSILIHICKVILYYDYILNLPAEIESFWNRKGFTWASFLFFVNRYLVLFGNVPVMVQFFWYPQDLAHKNIVRSNFLDAL